MKIHHFKFLCHAVAVAGLLWAGVPAVHAAKEVFKRAKPHVALGTIGQVEGELLLSDDPSDFVLVPFQARVTVFADSDGHVVRAAGIIQLGLPERSADGADKLVLEVLAARGITYEANRPRQLLLHCLRRGGGAPAEEFTVTVTRTPTYNEGTSTLNEDCLIWDIAGPGVHELVHVQSFMDLVDPPPGLDRGRVEWLLRLRVQPTDRDQPVLVFKDSSSAGVPAWLHANLFLKSDGTAGGTFHLRLETGEEIRLRAVVGLVNRISSFFDIFVGDDVWSLTVTPVPGDGPPVLYFALVNNELPNEGGGTWRFVVQHDQVDLEFIRSRARR